MYKLEGFYRGDDIREMIRNALLPVIGKKCVLFNLPYHDNVGDVLIWEGEETFFKENGIECIGRSSVYTFDCCKLEPDVTICINGGGYFGDSWRGFQEEINTIVKYYPNNRIVVFPQSVYYGDMDNMQLDSEVLGAHHDLFICARDQLSYTFLRKFFSNTILLIPDMALYIPERNMRIVETASKKQEEKKLFLKRTDKEATDLSRFDMEGMDIHDWPTIEYVYSFKNRVLLSEKVRRKLLRMGLRVLPHRFAFRLFERGLIVALQSDKVDTGKRWRLCYDELRYLIYLNQFKLKGQLNRLIDWYANAYYRPATIAYGAVFINQYDCVYTTRLHGGILGLIMGKTCCMIDNTNHKISAFYDTWIDYFGDRVSVI